jgi:hypothetical protein
MPKQARYYVSRVVKLGMIGSEEVLRALQQPTAIRRGDYDFTFTDIEEGRSADGTKFIFARLAKYTPAGSLGVVEPSQHASRPADVENLLIAASPFVYIPSFSGVAFQHIWGKLQKEQFERAFAGLVTEKYENFFAQALLEPISDLRSFVQKVARLNGVTDMDATVHPPNPLFGPIWKSLRDYIRQRNLREMKVVEHAQDGEGINSNLAAAAAAVLDAVEPPSEKELQKILSPEGTGIGDAAVLMAADGYGRAKVEGRVAGRKVVVRTADTHVHFMAHAEPEPDEIFDPANRILQRINADRYLEHP